MIIENGKFCVYVHTNKINGKMYVGITGRDPEKRWNGGAGYKGSSHFACAIKKYGWDNFAHAIFADKLTEQEAMHMEELLISRFNLQNPDYGYNTKSGGTNCSIPEETKKKIGNALRGREHPEWVRKIQSESKKGKKLSPEHCAAISKGNKGRPRTEKEMAAAKRLGEANSGDNHWTHRLGGMTDEMRKHVSEGLKKYFETHSGHESSNKKKVQCIETGIIYESIEDAAQKLHICRSQISEACVGMKRKTAGKCHWKFVNMPRD